jgi:hypothetical protein
MSQANAEREPLLAHASTVPMSHTDSNSFPPPVSTNTPTKPEVTKTPATPYVKKADTNSSWPNPAGLPMRGPNDENLIIFRRALGINFHMQTSDNCTLEEGRKTAIGIYKAVIREQSTKKYQHMALNILLYTCHFAQIVFGAVLTALGPSAADHSLVITILGAANTVIAGLLALIKGQGLPERLRKDEVEFRKLQDWIEETEALLAVGIIGRDRKEVGLLVEIAFKKYNAAKASEENNRPDSYVRQREEDDRDDDDTRSHGSGNAIVRLNLK